MALTYNRSSIACALLAFLMGLSCASGARDHRRQTNLEAKVGSHVVFNCYIDFPYDSPIPYLVHWSKDVSSVQQTQLLITTSSHASAVIKF